MQEVLRIETLVDEEVLAELQDIMGGNNYSWCMINDLLQAQRDNNALEFTLDDGDVIFEWNNLCDEKKQWERHGFLSIIDSEFDRDCLINLKVIPFKGGIVDEGKQGRILSTRLTRIGRQLVTTNLDEPGRYIEDLFVDPDKWEVVSKLRSMKDFADGDNSSVGTAATEESSYEAESEYEDEDCCIVGEDNADIEFE